MGLFKKALTNRAGTEDAERSTFWTTPWSWRTADAIYVGFNKEVWLYRQIDTNPLEWEDPSRRLQVGGPLSQMLIDLGSTSKDLGNGLRTLSRNREVHLLSVSWEAMAEIDDSAPDALRDYLANTLDFFVPHKAVVVGVKLRSSIANQLGKGGGSIMDQLKSVTVNAMGEGVPDLESYDEDYQLVHNICARSGAKVPSRDVMLQMESWYNLGRGPDVTIMEARDALYVDSVDTIEMAAVMKFDDPVMYAPNSQWILDALTHPDGPSVVSVRGELEPATVARARLRRSQRKVLSQMEEEAATQDLERVENSSTFQLAQEAENFFAGSREPLFTECSIVMGRRTTEAEETYIDELRNAHGIEMKPLEHRQLAALDETLPCSSKRVNPFLQDVSVSMLAYAGMQGFSNLGDKKGLYVGLTDPDYTPCWVDTLGAPANNLPPAMAIFGDPGGGKTFLCQMLATQAALSGLQVIMVNPKGFDSLSPTAELVGGQTVKMSQLEDAGGWFDPFRYAEPVMAAQILSEHILNVLGVGFEQESRVRLQAGLKRGAISGAKCAIEALEYVEDEHVKFLVKELASSNPTFALGIGTRPQSRLGETHKGLTLIEFDRKLDLPDASVTPDNYSDAQRVALAAIRLVSRSSLEVLNNAGGGVFILDEAWTFLSSNEGLGMLQQLGREGRSLNILPIFATQRVADLVREGVNLEGYLSRVFVMKLMEEREARAALQLCGLEATQARLEWLKDAGPKRAEGDFPGRSAYALHRDLYNRHAAVMVGPVPEAARVAFTTNPLERAERQRKQAAAQAAEAALAATQQPVPNEFLDIAAQE